MRKTKRETRWKGVSRFFSLEKLCSPPEFKWSARLPGLTSGDFLSKKSPHAHMRLLSTLLSNCTDFPAVSKAKTVRNVATIAGTMPESGQIRFISWVEREMGDVGQHCQLGALAVQQHVEQGFHPGSSEWRGALRCRPNCFAHFRGVVEALLARAGAVPVVA